MLAKFVAALIAINSIFMLVSLKLYFVSNLPYNKNIFLSGIKAILHKNHEKTLKIGTSDIRIWGIGIRLPKWSEYIRISDNSDIRTSTLRGGLKIFLVIGNFKKLD